MLLSNLEIVPGRRVVAHYGLVQGSTVRANMWGAISRPRSRMSSAVS